MSNEIANEQELNAALAEADANAGAIPDLSDGSTPEAVPVVVPVDQPEIERTQAADNNRDETATPPPESPSANPTNQVATTPSAPATPTDGKQLLDRFKKAKQTAAPAEAAAAAAVISPRAAKTAAAAMPAPPKRVRRPSRLIPIIDAMFRAIDRPFCWVPARARSVLGPIAIATLVVSALAGSLLPLLSPQKDVTDFIRERRAAAEQPVAVAGATATAGESGDKDGHGKSEPKAEHGEKKDAAKGENKEAKSGSHGDSKAKADAKKSDDAHGSKKSEAHGEKKDAGGHGEKPEKPEKEPGGGHGTAKSDAKQKPKADHGADKKAAKGGPH
ncbi:MAG: hypothetical protein JNG88_10580 [Phycisphaerales bacterium]|nr:hypothetical protein [Phycisphaerales bacterium]